MKHLYYIVPALVEFLTARARACRFILLPLFIFAGFSYSLAEVDGTVKSENVLQTNQELGTGPFITTWNTENAGISGSSQITIPTAATTGVVYNYTIYWEELGNTTHNGTETGITGNHTIEFGTPGQYRIEISGVFPKINFNNSGDKAKILTVEQWGSIQWSDMSNAFYGCNNLIVTATDAPDLSLVTNMNAMFRAASSFNQDINHWDVSSVANMGYLFRDAISFNQPLNGWNMANVTKLDYMFRDATAFNQDLNNWDVAKVTVMNNMFMGATSFNKDIGSWNVSSVKNMASMFNRASDFNKNIGTWDVSNVTNMSYMFQGATTFDQDISSWDVSSVANMSFMFRNATNFNQPIGGWNILNVNNISRIFEGAATFNQDLANWDVSNVTDLSYIFSGATDFDQNIGAWNLRNVTNMSFAFYGALKFDRDLSHWDISSVTNMNNMFVNSGLSAFNFDRLLEGWLENSNGVPSGIILGASGLEYCQAGAALQTLIDLHGWSIAGVTQNCSQSIAFSALVDKTYGDPDFALTANVSSGKAAIYTSSDETVATINGDVVTIVGVGATNITASEPGDAFYAAAVPVVRTLNVNKADQVITFEELEERTIGDEPFGLIASASSGLGVSFSSSDETIATIDGEIITIVGVGSSIITATQIGDGNYHPAQSVSQTLIVNKKTQSISFDALTDKTILDDSFELGGSATSGLPITYVSSDETVATVEGNIVSIVGLGTTTITASQAGNEVYASADPVMHSLNIIKAPQFIMLEPIADKQADDQPFDVVVSSSSNLEVSLSISGPATISGKTLTLYGAVGTVTVIAVQNGNENYMAAEPVEISFEVTVDAITGIIESSPSSVKIYPNPVKGYLQIELPKNIDASYSLLSMDGKAIFVDANSDQLDLSMLKSGIYLLKVTTTGVISYHKIMKQ